MGARHEDTLSLQMARNENVIEPGKRLHRREGAQGPMIFL